MPRNGFDFGMVPSHIAIAIPHACLGRTPIERPHPVLHRLPLFSPPRFPPSPSPLPLSYATNKISEIGELDTFTLLLDPSDGAETCYYQTGTDSTDVITDVLVEEAESGSPYPGVTIAGYTDGSLAGPNGEEGPNGIRTTDIDGKKCGFRVL